MSTAPERPHASRFAAVQPSSLLWLTVVWVALWGDVSFANVLGGLAVALLVMTVFPLPPVRMRLRVRPHWLLWLGVRFVSDVVVASLQVTWLTLTLRGDPRNALIRVRLRTDSELVLTLVGEMTSLVPGSIVVEVRRTTRTLYLHVLDARDEEGIERIRRRTLALERRVVMAIGADTSQVQEAP